MQGIACDAEMSEDRRGKSGAVCFALAQTAVAHTVRKWRRDARSVQRGLLLSCLTQLAEGSNLAQAVNVGYYRYFVALVVELEAMRKQQ